MRRRTFLASCTFPPVGQRVLGGSTILVNQNTQRPTELYFYPAPYRLADGPIMYTPFAVDADSCTSLFPEIAEMRGLVIMPYWSLISRERGSYDFSLIDKSLAFWGPRGKQLVIGVITVGFPLRVSHAKIVGATPDWLMGRIATYEQDASFIGSVKPIEPIKTRFRFASYWDAAFQSAEEDLIAALGRYDGHPAISKVRISTGITGEDNPTFDGLRAAMPGFTNMAWINYCSRMVAIYKGAFHRTPLEFDVDRLGWIKATGTREEQVAADMLIHDLGDKAIYIAMDGLDTPNSLDWISNKNTGPAKSIDYLIQQRQRGKQVGLEGCGLDRLTSKDLEVQADVFRKVQSSRMVLFSDVAGAINYSRHGFTAANALTVSLFGEAKLKDIARRGRDFFDQIGVEHFQL